MRNIISLILFILGFFTFAQNYKTAIGLKGGYPGYGSLSVKHFINNINAIEGNIGSGLYGFTVQGLYEWNKDLPTEGLNWYLGVGPNIGFYSKSSSAFFLSGSALLGIEYTFANIPLNLALDLGPIVQFVPRFDVGIGGGIAIRYAIK